MAEGGTRRMSKVIRGFKKYDQTFIEKILDWALRKVGGGVGLYRYGDPQHEGDKVKGSFLYQEFLRKFMGAYYPKKKDKMAFQFAAAHAAQFVKGEATLIVQGPGKSYDEKDFYLAGHFENVAGCIVNDISAEYGTSAQEAAQEQFSLEVTQSVALQNDFFKEPTIDESFDIDYPDFKFKGTPVMIVAGLTLSNMEGFPEDGLPKNRVVSILKRWRADLLKAFNKSANPQGNPLLIISVDHNQNGPMIEQAYQGQEEFTLNFPYRIVRDAPVSEGFNPEGFKVEYKWHTHSHVITHSLIPTEDMHYCIDGVPVFMPENERFIVNNTYKYPEGDWEDMVDLAAFNIKAKIQQPDNPIAVYVLEARFE